MEEQWISQADIMGMLSISRATLFRIRKKEDFPKPISIGKGEGTLRWNKQELMDWLAEQK